MSKYTTELRWIVENYAPNTQGVDNKINDALPFIFSFPYPIWEESYRQTLEHKIILHYYFREIAFETVELWKTFLNRKLNEIMPYYNLLYTTLQDNFNVKTDSLISESITRNRKDDASNSYTESTETTGTGTSNNTSSQSGEYLSSDMPQVTGAQELGSDQYANLINKNKSSDNTNIENKTLTDSSRNGSGSNIVNIGETILTERWGNVGGKTRTKLLMEYRQSLINIDGMIINDLKNLFFTLY